MPFLDLVASYDLAIKSLLANYSTTGAYINNTASLGVCLLAVAEVCFANDAKKAYPWEPTVPATVSSWENS